MVTLESPERKASRQRFGRMIRKLRGAAQELAPSPLSKLPQRLRRCERHVRVVLDPNIIASWLMSMISPPAQILTAVWPSSDTSPTAFCPLVRQ